MAGERVLTRRELNRALLERQLLLERRRLTAAKAVERLGGLQAQWTPAPYLSLLARLEGFAREELTKAIERRRLVKALLQRGTLHVVTPGDYWAFSTARRELGGVLWPPAYEALVPKAKLARLARLVLAELEAGERTFKELRALLEPHARGAATPTFLWRRVQGHASVVHVPPSGIWGYGGEGVYAPAATVLARATVLAQGQVISADHIHFTGTDNRRLFDLGERVRRGTSLEILLEEVSRNAIEEALHATQDDRAEAASLLGLTLNEFNKRARAVAAPV